MGRTMKYIPVLFLVLLAGCATPRWTQVGGEYKNETLNIVVDLPQGWVRMGNDNALIATREGLLLQRIMITQNEIEKALPNTKKKFRQGMLPQETAEVALDQFASDPKLTHLAILENKPAAIGGISGFRAVFTYRIKDGARYRDVYYGFLLKDRFYYLRYSAAQRYYFNRDAETFEKVVKSFRLIAVPEGSPGTPTAGK